MFIGTSHRDILMITQDNFLVGKPFCRKKKIQTEEHKIANYITFAAHLL